MEINPDKDIYYLELAKAASSKSKCLKRRYGAIIVKDDEVIATGYNGPPRGEAHCTACSRVNIEHNTGSYEECQSVHAEMNAMLSASRSQMIGATLYLAGFEGSVNIESTPCNVCKRLIKNSGISRVVGLK